MEPLIQSLLTAGIINPQTAEILNRQIATEVARQWAEDSLFAATQATLSARQEQFLALLLESDFRPSGEQLNQFWASPNTVFGGQWLDTVRTIAGERATIAAVRAGQAATFDLVNRSVIDWANRYYNSTDPNAFGSIPNLIITERRQAYDAFLAWQQGALGGRADGLPQLRRALEPTFGPVRSNRIAVTETTRIFTRAVQEAERNNPFTVGFRWLTADPCEICAPMNNMTRRKDEGYPRGLSIPAHVLCKCEEVPVTELTE